MAPRYDELAVTVLRLNPDAPITRVLYRYRWHPGSLTMNAGNASLLQGMRDGVEIARRYLSSGSGTWIRCLLNRLAGRHSLRSYWARLLVWRFYWRPLARTVCCPTW